MDQLVTSEGVVLYKALLPLFCRVVMWISWLLARAWFSIKHFYLCFVGLLCGSVGY